MPINLGEFGTLWGKSVVTIYIKPSCYTHELLDQEEYFTLCFLPTWYYSALNILGSTSGRDTDKIKKSGLKPIELPNGVSYSVAEETFICKKLYKQTLIIYLRI
ncbi:hypothetical protein BCR32DRAFT_326421 [Anaeromyces robustus]|uniref:Flavin reductase like domain-containing protein n=1 Tax=Anaeromyces robustus TaxID=1754192 RepID=A0A1Y1XCA9_9FUNG|nr:hypothetical protein BCR32DRAFT_326421 [Anaeromyces robustus]|eukprot:ORX83368.1 hypothetical protein BCR32DRAFT_326421 [Anaeromyces robustus]